MRVLHHLRWRKTGGFICAQRFWTAVNGQQLHRRCAGRGPNPFKRRGFGGSLTALAVWGQGFESPQLHRTLCLALGPVTCGFAECRWEMRGDRPRPGNAILERNWRIHFGASNRVRKILQQLWLCDVALARLHRCSATSDAEQPRQGHRISHLAYRDRAWCTATILKNLLLHLT